MNVRITARMGCEVVVTWCSSAEVEVKLVAQAPEGSDVVESMFSRLGPIEARTLAHALLSWCEEPHRS